MSNTIRGTSVTNTRAQAFSAPKGDLVVLVERVTKEYVVVPTDHVQELLDDVKKAGIHAREDPPDAFFPVRGIPDGAWLFGDDIANFKNDIENHLNGSGDPVPPEAAYLVDDE